MDYCGHIVHTMGVMYYPKGIFPRATSQVTISHVATSLMCHFPSGNFSKVRLGPLRPRRLYGGMGRALRLGWNMGAEPCGKDRLRKLPLGNLHIWEVATRENTLGKMPLGKNPLGK